MGYDKQLQYKQLRKNSLDRPVSMVIRILQSCGMWYLDGTYTLQRYEDSKYHMMI